MYKGHQWPACKESSVWYPGASRFCYWAGEFCSLLTCRNEQVKFLGEFKYHRRTVISAHQKMFCELVEITFWLVHVSYSLPGWQVVNLTFFAPCIWWLLINCKVFLLLGLFCCCTTNYWTKYYTQHQGFHKALLYELISTLTRKGLVLYYSQAWSSISPKMPLINLLWFKSWINL